MDLMIDLETLGTAPDAPVISLGATFFDIEARTLGVTFYMALDVSEQLQRGRKPSGDTLKWWMKQSGAAKKVFHEKSRNTAEVLQLFSNWIKANHKNPKVWGNGATFDISLMEHLYRDYGLDCPWKYTNIMDLRTFKRFVGKGKPIVKKGVDHNALDDALAQAQYVLENS